MNHFRKSGAALWQTRALSGAGQSSEPSQISNAVFTKGITVCKLDARAEYYNFAPVTGSMQCSCEQKLRSAACEILKKNASGYSHVLQNALGALFRVGLFASSSTNPTVRECPARILNDTNNAGFIRNHHFPAQTGCLRLSNAFTWPD